MHKFDLLKIYFIMREDRTHTPLEVITVGNTSGYMLHCTKHFIIAGKKFFFYR